MFNIGPYQIQRKTVLAPMAGVTDLPFRQLCREMGAGLVVSEMVAADPSTWSSRKSKLRIQFADEPAPRSVQIAGYDPQMMAEAARFNVQQGAEIIDINMGCPAKKVLKKAAGSALLQHPDLVRDILHAVVESVEVPVTLKIRTGWDRQNRNAVTIGKIAEDAGIAALAIHGRTRACRFVKEVEYDSIADVVSALSIPVIANGDITSPEKALTVLAAHRCCRRNDRPWGTGQSVDIPTDQSVSRDWRSGCQALHRGGAAGDVQTSFSPA